MIHIIWYDTYYWCLNTRGITQLSIFFINLYTICEALKSLCSLKNEPLTQHLVLLPLLNQMYVCLLFCQHIIVFYHHNKPLTYFGMICCTFFQVKQTGLSIFWVFVLEVTEEYSFCIQKPG